MARKSEISGAKTSFGNAKKHRRGQSGAGGRWRFKAPKTRRTWKPNLRKAKVKVNGTVKRMKMTMKDYKKLKQEDKIA